MLYSACLESLGDLGSVKMRMPVRQIESESKEVRLRRRLISVCNMKMSFDSRKIFYESVSSIIKWQWFVLGQISDVFPCLVRIDNGIIGAKSSCNNLFPNALPPSVSLPIRPHFSLPLYWRFFQLHHSRLDFCCPRNNFLFRQNAITHPKLERSKR